MSANGIGKLFPVALHESELNSFSVILDEAQCIKNKASQSAKACYVLEAQYRLCMTGTPMMNNVGELFSLIHFCRIKPFCVYEKFSQEISRPLRNLTPESDRAMKKLQGLIRATMLRRTKKSKLDGRPLIELPERHNNLAALPFGEDEKSFYDALESKTQVQFNKYVKAGTVGKHYTNILVLLLRLRQACCHPHLIRDLSEATTTGVAPDVLVEFARQLSPDAVRRINDANGDFDCPICMEYVPHAFPLFEA
jgi:SNF2 family DNA or RNA helicase